MGCGPSKIVDQPDIIQSTYRVDTSRRLHCGREIETKALFLPISQDYYADFKKVSYFEKDDSVFHGMAGNKSSPYSSLKNMLSSHTKDGFIAKGLRQLPPGARQSKFLSISDTEFGFFHQDAVGDDIKRGSYLFTTGQHKIKLSKLSNIERQNIKTLSSGKITFPDENEKIYTVHNILECGSVALLLAERGMLKFFGQKITIFDVSDDECHVSSLDSRGDSYVVFRVRRNCLALFKEVTKDTVGSPKIFKDAGVYVIPKSKLETLIIYDFNDPNYCGDDNLKVLHLLENNIALYYSQAELDARMALAESAEEVQVATGSSMFKKINSKGIHVLYNPQAPYFFQIDAETKEPK